MTRRTLLSALPAAALPEVTAPSTPEARLRESVARWCRAERDVAATLRTLTAAREMLPAAMQEGASERALTRLVEATIQARSEWRSAQREAAEAEQVMEAAARNAREG